MRRRFFIVWMLTLCLFSSLLVWRLAIIRIPPAIATRQIAATVTPQLPAPIRPFPKKTPSRRVTPLRKDFMAGVIFPQWGKQAYSDDNHFWNKGLQEISEQAHAHWLSLPITFHQEDATSTQVETQDDIPPPQTVAHAIVEAHTQGYKVFIYPLLTVDSQNHWAGQVDFASQEDADLWFRSYWQQLYPYLVAANAVHVDQFSIGNEFELLEGHFDDKWRTLIDQVHSVYRGTVVYSINWSSLQYPLPAWLHYSGLNAIGISTYFPLVDEPRRLDFSGLPKLWQQRVGDQIDAFAQEMKKPIFISEIGYRNTQDAGYLPYKSDPGTRRVLDDNEQAYLYEAALQDSVHDQYINGVFIWAWGIAPYDPNNKPAAQVLKKWFSVL